MPFPAGVGAGGLGGVGGVGSSRGQLRAWAGPVSWAAGGGSSYHSCGGRAVGSGHQARARWVTRAAEAQPQPQTVNQLVGDDAGWASFSPSILCLSLPLATQGGGRGRPEGRGRGEGGVASEFRLPGPSPRAGAASDPSWAPGGGGVVAALTPPLCAGALLPVRGLRGVHTAALQHAGCRRGWGRLQHLPPPGARRSDGGLHHAQRPGRAAGEGRVGLGARGPAKALGGALVWAEGS